MAANLPLFRKIHQKNTAQRVLDTTVLFLLVCLLIYRVLSLRERGFPWVIGLMCETWFTFLWLDIIITRWTPVYYDTFPRHLLQSGQELPAVDMFVTTADPVLEPPIITVNTVLSLLAVDYPPDKLACYVSDDACSPLIFYALLQASNFAKLWVPFCKKYNVQVRAPFMFFSKDPVAARDADSEEFKLQFESIKEEYEKLKQSIEDATQKEAVFGFDLKGDMAVFSNTNRLNHPPIVKILSENKNGVSDAIPHIIYVSREKRPKQPHNYKAGAMNVLTRVSGVMTNAPFMLNLDCDVFANNPQIIRHAMCLHLGSNERDCAFVQCPQMFHDSDSFLVLHEYLGKGIVGTGGPFYGGTGCFHRRKVIYGLWPNDTGGRVEKSVEFGHSKQLVQSAAYALKGKTGSVADLSSSLEAAHEVAGSAYEYGTSWGDKIGWIYGSTVEDILTGLTIHRRGWKSAYCNPEPPAFLGTAPSDSLVIMIQQRRWCTGLLEILFSKHNPISAFIRDNLSFRQCMAYLYILMWGLRPIPELCYALLPAYCLITNSNFLPSFQEPGICIFLAVFATYYLYNLSEYIMMGLPIQLWWINQRMGRVIAMTAWLLGLFNVVLKHLGISETVFEITKKVDPHSSCKDQKEDENAGKFMFDKSPVFVLGTMVLLVHLVALGVVLLGLQPPANHGFGSGFGEMVCSVIVVLCFKEFVEGLFRKGKYGIPVSTLCKSAALLLPFLVLCFTST